MPYVAGRYLPESIRSINRSTQSARVRLVINPDPNAPGPEKYSFQYQDIAIGQQMKTRRMLQKSKPENFYEFTYPPTQIAYEGMGVELTEIPRPLLTPLIDLKQSRNYKAVFEFLVAENLDGLSKSVEQQLVTLEWMANSAEPVYFENFDTFLTNGFWYIAEFAVKTSRVNTNGEITAAQCSLSLLEYQDTETKFAKFPKLNYKDLTRRGGGGGGGGGGGEPDNSEQGADGASTEVSRNTGNPPEGSVSTTKAIQGTRYYRFSRQSKPNRNKETYAHLWRKEGNRYVYYSTSPTLPAPIGARVARGFYARVTASMETGFVSELRGDAKKNYEVIVAATKNYGRILTGG